MDADNNLIEAARLSFKKKKTEMRREIMGDIRYLLGVWLVSLVCYCLGVPVLLVLFFGGLLTILIAEMLPYKISELRKFPKEEKIETILANGFPLPLDLHLVLFPNACPVCGSTRKEFWSYTYNPQSCTDGSVYTESGSWCARCAADDPHQVPWYAEPIEIIHISSPFLADDFSGRIPDPIWPQ